MMTDRPGFALYVHWPFCQAKCPYCDFNSHVASQIHQKTWVSAYVSEIERYARELPDRILDTIFFGGGTPSLMEPDTVGAVVEAARGAWRWSNEVEITLEANPTSVEAGRFRGFRDAGVNRVSVGLQALNDPDLRALGRLHTAREGIAAFHVAQDVFERVSFDLIYARQGQSLGDWRQELNEALALAADHLSLYQLTIEPGTVFAARHLKGGLKGLPGEEVAADMFDLTQELTEAAGFPAYEISNHAAAGSESRHNLIYWRSGEWVGVGPGAHGRLDLSKCRVATEAHASPVEWLAAAESGSGEGRREEISLAESFEERVMMGLRLREGIPESWFQDYEKINYINGLVEAPLLEQTNGRLRLTPTGRPLLNAVLRELLA